jgi:ferritin-like protein
MATLRECQLEYDNMEPEYDEWLDISYDEWECEIEGLVAELTFGKDALTDDEAREIAIEEIGTFDDWYKARRVESEP